MPQRTNRATLLGGSVIAAVLLALIGCQRNTSSSDGSDTATKPAKLAGEDEPAIELVIDYGDGAEKRFTRIPHKEGMTALGALQFAAQHPRGIAFEASGSGESALLTRIDDLTNQASNNGKNWLYRVNGKLGTKSCDAYVLSPGDVILWKFEEYE